MSEDAPSLSDEECARVFVRLFPGGPTGADVRIEIAPDGWEATPLHRVFHPTVEQAIEEALRSAANLRRLGKEPPPDAAETAAVMERTLASYRPQPVERDAEVATLVGMSLWDIFSDNHEVIAPDRRVVDIGSFRGAGHFIADWLNRHLPGARYGYMDFYMGTALVAHRADIGPVHRMIFGRMRMSGLDWEYHFPRLLLLDTRPLWRASDGDEGPPPPAEDDAAIRKLQDDLGRIHAEAVAEACQAPPPSLVESYRCVYGRFPIGWPPRP